MKKIDDLMRNAVCRNVFPGGVLLVSKKESILFFEAYGYANIFSRKIMTRDTIFDLASLTKPLATTLAVISLIQQKKLKLDQYLGTVLPLFKKSDKGNIKIKDLLCHQSGFPDYRPYYEKLCKLSFKERKTALKGFLAKESLQSLPGKTALYSDLGFMILGLVVESVSGMRLDHFVTDLIYRPLGIYDIFFIDLCLGFRHGFFAATEFCPWRNLLLEGVVHDENAYAMGGIAGHAGLFGTAGGLYILLKELLSVFQGSKISKVFRKELLVEFFKRRNNTDRTYGFDTPSPTKSSSGIYFSKKSVGHLGFTGTSFWMDIDDSIIIILLTNRVHPLRDNNRIQAFRPELHNAVMEFMSNA